MSDFEVIKGDAIDNASIRNEHKKMVSVLTKPGADILATLTPDKVNLWHHATGFAGEALECLDAVKKFVVYNKDMDRANIIEELGDAEFYMEGIRAALGVTREEVLAANIHKLSTGPKARYKSGYSDAAAQARADKVDGETAKQAPEPAPISQRFKIGSTVRIKAPDEWPILNSLQRPVTARVIEFDDSFSIPYIVMIPDIGDVCFREEDLIEYSEHYVLHVQV